MGGEKQRENKMGWQNVQWRIQRKMKKMIMKKTKKKWRIQNVQRKQNTFEYILKNGIWMEHVMRWKEYSHYSWEYSRWREEKMWNACINSLSVSQPKFPVWCESSIESLKKNDLMATMREV